ncbi:MAG TPA: hypothetical protein P5079_08825, partial [Elusimicrobiota bacterium]|nr:hypothetical protein [Elusimicrobiota bacterium]
MNARQKITTSLLTHRRKRVVAWALFAAAFLAVGLRAETVPPEELFSHYLYFSSFSDALVEHARLLAERMIARRDLGPASRVIEAASNDGYLLQHYLRKGIPVLGIEP